jgi:hypothetical protein
MRIPQPAAPRYHAAARFARGGNHARVDQPIGRSGDLWISGRGIRGRKTSAGAKLDHDELHAEL